MNKLKKLFVLMITIISVLTISMIIIPSVVKAAFGEEVIGATWTLNFDQLENNSLRLYCVNHGASLNNEGDYDYVVDSIIKINQDKSLTDANKAYIQKEKDGKFSLASTNEWNAKMAYVLANGTGYSGDFNGWYSETQMAVYYYFNEFINPIKGTWGKNDREFGATDKDKNNIIKGAEEYWTKLQKWQSQGGVAKDNTVKDASGKVSTTLEKYSSLKLVEPDKHGNQTVTHDNSSYLKVGPLNWQFSGDIESIEIKDQNDKAVKVHYAKMVNNSLKTIESTQVKSGEDFYVLIPSNAGVTEIKAKFKLTKLEVYNAKLILLRAPGYFGAEQNVIKGTGETVDVNSDDIEYTYSLKTGSIEIAKKDAYNKSVAIEGVKFKLKHKATGLYVAKTKKGDTYYTACKDITAKTFETDRYGKIDITGLAEGEYIAEEVGFNANTTAKNYTINTGKTTKISLTKDQITSGKLVKETIYNIKNPIEIKIKGKVWSPVKTDDKAQNTKTDDDAKTYNKNDDYLVHGVKVSLYRNAKLVENYDKTTGNLESVKLETIKDENGKAIEQLSSSKYEYKDANGKTISTALVNSAVTDKNGEYTLTTMVSYPELELSAYNVKFKYEGLDFKACSKQNYANKANGSKAREVSTERTALNEMFDTIAGITAENEKDRGIVLSKNKRSTDEIKYKFTSGSDNGYGTSVATNMSVGYSSKDKVITIGDEKQINSQKFKHEITAVYNFKTNSKFTGDAQLYNPGVLGKYKNLSNREERYYNSTTATVSGINLALIVRESPDLTVSNEVETVVTSINGYNNLYKRIASEGDPDNKTINVQVRYVKDETELRKLPIYPSDVEAFDINDSAIKQRLQVYITYKVSITNMSTNLYNKVKELSIYYNDGLELLWIGNDLDKNKKNYCANADFGTGEDGYYSRGSINGYTKTSINLEKYGIAPEKTKSIYMTYKLKDSYVANAINKQDEDIKKIKTAAEISAYSTYSDSKYENVYAGIDKNSAPGNLTANELNNNFKIENIDNDSAVARALTVRLNEARKMTGTVFLDESIAENNTRTSNGIYDKNNDKVLKNVTVKLVGQGGNGSNIVEGNNNIDIKAENYDATYDDLEENNTYKISGFIPGNYKIAYTYNNETYYEDVDGQHKINTIDYKSAIVKDVENETKIKTAFTNNANNLDWYKLDNPQSSADLNKEFNRYNEAVDNFETRKMIDSYYANMNMSNTGSTGENLISDKNYDMTASTPVMGVTIDLQNIETMSTGNELISANYQLKNMDFGITERPRQSLKLNKKVSSIKVTLANGQTLIDAKVENGKIQGNASGIKLLPSSDTTRGKVSIELDSELIHGSTLEIGYKIEATNNGEVDYTNKEYYMYGEGGTTPVKIKLGTVADYVSNDLVFDSNTNSNWKIADVNINKTDDNKDVTEENTLTINKTVNAKNNILYTDVKNNELMKSNMNTIITTDYLSSKELASGETTDTVELVLTRLLSNTDEEMTYNNDVELLSATNNNGGRRISTQLGKYSFAKEGIGGSSEEVTITPPTGANKDYVIYYTVGIALVIFLIAGATTFIIVKRKNK